MKKFNKILSIVLICLAVALGIYILISFIINKDGTMYWINYFIDVFNKPLPIIGITVGALLLFIWRLVISTNYGKSKISEYDAEIEKIKKEKDNFIESANSKIKELESKNQELANENSELKGIIVDVCALSTNKKIKDFGKALDNYGKETTDTETKAD